MRKLYYEDCHISRFTATVTDCRPVGAGYAVELDQTAFFPGGGGQACDTGTLGAAHVTGMTERDDIPVHLCDAPLAIGETVEGKLDWTSRFAEMQQHTGEHILSGLIFSRYGFHNTGFHMNTERIQVDFDGVIPAPDIRLLEDAVNEAVWKNLPVLCYTPEPDALQALTYRTKRPLPWPVRIVEIPGYDRCACCGVHTASTGEAGPVKIWSSAPCRGGTRLEMACGMAALNHLNAVFAQARNVSHLLSAPPEKISDAVEEMSSQLEQVKYRLRKLELAQLGQIAEKQANRGNVVLFCPPLDGDLPVVLADRTAEVCGGTAAIFSGAGDKWRWCLIDRHTSVVPLAEEMTRKLGARGGGKPGFRQGQVHAEKDAIRNFFSFYCFSFEEGTE